MTHVVGALVEAKVLPPSYRDVCASAVEATRVKARGRATAAVSPSERS